ncbi:MAG: ABC transporter permease [Rikenellaceae bacterium]
MFLIARRYLFSKKSHSVVNIIAGVSLVSVAIPVAAIIILLSVFNGFGNLVEGLNASVDADLVISPSRGQYFMTERVDTTAIRRVEGVENFSLMASQTLMLEYGGRQTVVTLRGVDDSYVNVVPIADYMYAGDFEVRLGDLDRIVLGNATASKLGVRNLRQSVVGIYSLRSSRLSSFAPMVGFEQDSARVSGVYMVDMDSEGRYAYTSLRLMNRLMGGDDEDQFSNISDIAIRVAPNYSTKEVKSQVEQIVGEEFRVQSREELNPLLYDIIRYEKWGIIFISSMVMLLASFSLIGIVAMLIIEKRDDMLTLRAMGATKSSVRDIFFMQGMLISGIGACVGLVVSVGVILIQQIWGVVKLPASGFVVDIYPVDLQMWDVVGVLVMSMVVAAILNYIVTFEMIKK